jgi:hypothetical protein
MWWRWRGFALASALVLASVGAGVAGAQVRANVDANSPAALQARERELARMTVLLSRIHHAAEREVELGDLAHLNASLPQTRRYGVELASDFRAFDQRLVAFAARKGIDEDRLKQVYAGENTAALRREADDLARLAGERGERYDRRFWVIMVHDQSAASDMLASAATTEPELINLIADMSRLLDRSSRKALQAAEPVLEPSQPQPAPASPRARPSPSPAPKR